MKRLLALGTMVAAVVAFPAAVAAAVAPGTYPATVDFANAPSGTHFGSGSSAPTCTVASNLDISCTGYTLQGVGHTNATLNLTATYTVSYTCTNGGRQLVVAQGKTQPAPGLPQTIPSTKNGGLPVPTASEPVPFTVGDTGSGSPCPNRNWTWTISSVTLDSFTYTLTFEGFTDPAISISAS